MHLVLPHRSVAFLLGKTMSETTELPVNNREDLRADLEAAVKGMETPETTEAAVESDVSRETSSDDTRPRDASGRFLPKSEIAETETPETVAEPIEAKPAEEKAAEPAEKAPAKAEPPAVWTAADKEMFGKQTPEAQAFLLRRQGEMDAYFTRQNQQSAALRRDYEPVRQMFEPHAAVMRDKGFTPASLINAWFSVEKNLMDGRGVDVIADIAKSYNIPPAAIAQRLGITAPRQAPPGAAEVDAEGNVAAAPPNPSVDPAIAQALGGVIHWINNAEQRQQQDRIAQQQAAERQVMSEIARFSAEKDASGQPLRPYFAAVEHDMATIATAYKQNGGDIPPLPELYDYAVRANPITFARLQADQTAAQEAQRRAAEQTRQTEARAKAVKAQRASAPVTGVPGTGHAAANLNGTASLRDDIRAALVDHSS